VLQAVPGARFVITGGPPPFSPSAVAAQWLETQHTPFLGRIHFTGWQSPAQIGAPGYAAADILVVPSRYEPCGLNQIYSLKYGTVPVVRATGGLDDTIEQWDPTTGKGTGFKFERYSSLELWTTIQQALEVYKDKSSWQKLMKNGMARDFSWEREAKEYVKVYERAIKLRTV